MPNIKFEVPLKHRGLNKICRETSGDHVLPFFVHFCINMKNESRRSKGKGNDRRRGILPGTQNSGPYGQQGTT